MYSPSALYYAQQYYDKRTKRYVTKEVEKVEPVEEVALTEEEELHKSLADSEEIVGEVNSIMKVNP